MPGRLWAQPLSPESKPLPGEMMLRIVLNSWFEPCFHLQPHIPHPSPFSLFSVLFHFCWASVSSFNVTISIVPLGLCTGCFPCLERSHLRLLSDLTAATTFRFSINISASGEPFLTSQGRAGLPFCIEDSVIALGYRFLCYIYFLLMFIFSTVL